ncbi:putative ankyrin repeat protein [Chloropicon roscoffensis]|uniref:Ankyrin repeat protein n=1 Tax=Chloropicon roscoffensis TaxID=1461544 RepID=A0AAX4PEL5_9CHLO
MVAGAAGEPSAKSAKVDEAKEEEDPLVRRKEEVVVAAWEARSREDARAERVARRELLTLCADFEAKNEKLLGRLLPELWHKIVDENVQQNDVVALAMTCRFFRDTTKVLGKKIETNLGEKHFVDLRERGKVASHSLGWFQWVCDTFEIRPFFWYPEGRVEGAVYEGDLVNYAAFQGSVEILRWLMEENYSESNEETGEWAGWGGSIEVLEYLRGYEFDEWACSGAARGGCLEALKFLRGLDPPCPWDWGTCACAARGGHLDVLKFLRSQDPPCPWNEETCARAAEGGHLDVLKWLRDQDPPCPWDAWTCANAAGRGHLDVLKWARSEHPPCPWNEKTCALAAGEGQLDILKWSRDQDPPCPWGEKTCRWAAREGQLEILKWLRAQKPPCLWCRRWCSDEALRSGHQHVVDWIDQREDESDVEYNDGD